MDVNCIICSDLFSQGSDVVLNQCGHMFHNTCLLQWIERSKTCPQCRTRATPKTIFKVYFNYINTDHITDNVGTLQAKLDSANFRVQLKEKELKDVREKADGREAQNISLKELVKDLEASIRSAESSINGLKEQVSFYRNKAKEVDRQQSEIVRLKSTLENVEKVQTVINGTRAEVTEILKNETNIEALALLSATLKKTLLDAERKNSVLQSRYKHTQNDLTKYKRECSALETSNKELRKLLEENKKTWKEEKNYLRKKIESFSVAVMANSSKSEEKVDTSVDRILLESPAPLPRRRELQGLEIRDSPTVAEAVVKIKESDSPYLPVKTNFVLFEPKFSRRLDQNKSIFKTPQEPSTSSKTPTFPQTVYNGLGGQVNEDYYKFPEKKSPKLGLKRHKSSSSVPSSKFRKLAPLATSKKITDFLSAETYDVD